MSYNLATLCCTTAYSVHTGACTSRLATLCCTTAYSVHTGACTSRLATLLSHIAPQHTVYTLVPAHPGVGTGTIQTTHCVQRGTCIQISPHCRSRTHFPQTCNTCYIIYTWTPASSFIRPSLRPLHGLPIACVTPSQTPPTTHTQHTLQRYQCTYGMRGGG